MFANNLKTTKKCVKESGCIADDSYKTLTGSPINPTLDPTSKGYSYRLANGTSIMVLDWDDDCSATCGEGKLKESFWVIF